MALDQMAKDALDATPNTCCSIKQDGAISLPLYWNDGDLPIGSQLVDRYGDETTLLQVARQLEEAQPGRIENPVSSLEVRGRTPMNEHPPADTAQDPVEEPSLIKSLNEGNFDDALAQSEGLSS